jgi:hypothetical protein
MNSGATLITSMILEGVNNSTPPYRPSPHAQRWWTEKLRDSSFGCVHMRDANKITLASQIVEVKYYRGRNKRKGVFKLRTFMRDVLVLHCFSFSFIGFASLSSSI